MNLARTVETFAMLGEESRMRLCALLHGRAMNVSELVLVTGLTQSRVSTHLAKLRDAGIVKDLLYLDLALEQALRTVIERAIHSSFSGEQLLELIARAGELIAPFAPKRRPVGIVLGICAACAALILSAGIVSAVSAPPKLASAAATNALAANGKTGAALPVATPAPEPPSVGEAVPAPAAPAVATPPARGAEKAAHPALPGRPKIAPKVPAKRPVAKPTKPAKAKRPL